MLTKNWNQDDLKNLPKSLLIITFTILALGIKTMHDISDLSRSVFFKQTIFALTALSMMFFCAFLKLRTIFNYSYLFYGLSVILLLLVSFFGHKAMGATRWLSLGIIKFQPSELVKIAVIMALARYFHMQEYDDIRKMKFLATPVAIVAIPTIIVLKQPDLGTAFTIICLAVTIFFAVGVRMRNFILAATIFLITIPVIWHHLRDYQKKRILTFINPDADKLGSGYNIIQSKIAIGSGGAWGKNVLEGSQAKLNFLPEYRTDFVFSFVAEKYGFVFSAMLIILYLMMIFYGMRIAANCRSVFGRVIAVGMISVISLHVFINIGMVCGLLPVVGIPLPLISYGGTSLNTTLMAIGMIIAVKLNSKNKM